MELSELFGTQESCEKVGHELCKHSAQLISVLQCREPFGKCFDYLLHEVSLQSHLALGLVMIPFYS